MVHTRHVGSPQPWEKPKGRYGSKDSKIHSAILTKFYTSYCRISILIFSLSWVSPRFSEETAAEAEASSASQITASGGAHKVRPVAPRDPLNDMAETTTAARPAAKSAPF